MLKTGLVCFFFFIHLLLPDASQASTYKCGPLRPPSNGGYSCTRGNKFGSKCTLRCAPGHVDARLAANRGRATFRICSCVDGVCSWTGPEFKCQEFKCPEPDFIGGEVAMVDQWEEGFNAVVEFSNLPQPITTGWSVKVHFDPPLGVSAEVETWSSVLASASMSRDSLTLVNIIRNSDTTRSTLRTSFVVDKAEPVASRKVFVGLYKSRILNLECYNPPLAQQKVLKKLELTAKATTSPPTTTTTTTVAPTTALPATTAKKTTTVKETTEKTDETDDKTTTTTTEQAETEEGATEKTTTVEGEVKETTTMPAIVERTGDKLTDKVEGRFCKLQQSSPYFPQRGWIDEGSSFFSILTKLTVEKITSDWIIAVVFGHPVTSVEVWNTNPSGSEHDGRLWKFKSLSWNKNLVAGKFDMAFNARFEGVTPDKPNALVYLCSGTYSSGDPVSDLKDEFKFIEDDSDSNQPEPEQPNPTEKTEPVLVTAKPLDQYKSKRCKSATNGKVPKNKKQTKPVWKKTADNTAPVDYNEVLHKSLLFYDAQRAGRLPKYNKIPWRGDSTMRDGCDYGADLSGGWFDAGDTVKFTFPLAATLTNLAWGGIVYEDAYKQSANYPHLLNTLRWATTWLIRAHPKKYELVVMVGHPKQDHGYWGRPEELNMARPVYKIDSRNPGTEVAAEAAAALAASSLLFSKSYRQLSRASLRHAKGLYELATKFRGDYHVSVPLVKDFYKSWSGYKDELVWAAAWMYKATGEQKYLVQAKKFYAEMNGQYLAEREISWDRKMISAQILLANLTGEEQFRAPIQGFMKTVMKMPTTPQGIMYLNPWAPNRYAANAAMVAIMASQLHPPIPNRDAYFKWGEDQIHRIMGLKGGRSYIIGVGKDWPKRPHHRASSCPFPPLPCNHQQLSASGDNPITLFGALVGGPGLDGKFHDDRNDYRQNEVALDYNAGWQTAVAGLKHHSMQKKS